MDKQGIAIAPNAHIAKECVLVGNVTIGSDSSVFYHSTLRGDIEPIVIKDGTNVQDNCVFHASTGSPVTVGNGVTIGHSSIIHGCEIGDNSLIGMGSIVMNGAKIGRNCLLGAGSLVTEGTHIPDGSLAYGRPAKVIRPLKEEEIASLYHSRDVYIECSRRLFGNYEDRK
jgi:carbonic anhydrase/acetyltransferase-like protein (isoleucine patch superfamily)